MTAPCPHLSHLADIIAGWERAEGITMLHAWMTDAGSWRVWWTESNAVGVLGGGENHLKVSWLVLDIKEALKAHGIDARHIARPGPTSIIVWTAEGQYLRWDAPERLRPRAEGVAA